MNTLRNGDRTQFSRLLRENSGAANAKGPGGWTPIMYAALYGDAATVNLLLTGGANPNAQNDDGGTALMYAIDSEQKTKMLLDHGANPNLRSGEGRTALVIAVGRAGCYPVVKLLLDKGADARIEPSDGPGLLNSATGSLDPRVFQLLLDHGASSKALPLSPLLVAGCTACFDMLLPLANSAGLAGGLQGAIRTGDIPRIKTLLDRGARPGASLLQTVAASRAPIPAETIRSLISHGADVNAKTSSGLTMVDFAKKQGNATLVDILTQAGVSGENSAPPVLLGKPAPSPRAAMERIIPSLQRADAAFLSRGGCVSCHNNSLTAMTIAAARAKGVTFNDQIAKDQSRKIAAFLRENAERALENEGLPGAVDTVSYILLGMAAYGYPSDPVTDVWSRFVKNNQSSDGRWVCIALRPPLESSDFQVTAASIRSLKTYHPKSQETDFEKSVERGVRWLEAATPNTTEDLVFKILGLTWGGGSRSAIRATAQELLARQSADGGWSQTRALHSDAYATGQALVALKESNAIPTGDRAYQRGVQYLLNSQLQDGSWHVQSRTPAFQPYFDSDFPHGSDQFISAAASNWAAMALATVVR
ncbi:MAG: ankyrin repeat domain-containing protein [Candidatus Solibacter sp.]